MARFERVSPEMEDREALHRAWFHGPESSVVDPVELSRDDPGCKAEAGARFKWLNILRG